MIRKFSIKALFGIIGLAVLLVIASAVLLIEATIVFSPRPDMGPHEETMRFVNRIVVRNGNNLNISFTLSRNPHGDKGIVKIEGFRINNASQAKIQDLSIFLNGTQVDNTSSLSFIFEYCDNIQVNLILPQENLPCHTDQNWLRYHPGELEVKVYTFEAYYSTDFSLPPSET